MDEITIRDATETDIAAAARLQSAMLAAMESYGGPPVADPTAREAFFAGEIRERLGRPAFRYVVAAGADGGLVGVASGEVVSLPSAFVPRRVLHVGTVHVLPENRSRGIGRSLVEALLEHGRDAGCVEADLNVLDGNPARRLYERMGFSDVQRKMTRDL